MQFGKKKEFVPVYKPKPEVKQKKVTIDFTTHVIDTSATIPHGKYQGAILSWVIKNDDWYYNWMQENNIIAEWGLYRLKETVKKEYNHFVSPTTGQVWIGLRLVDNTDNFVSLPFL